MHIHIYWCMEGSSLCLCVPAYCKCHTDTVIQCNGYVGALGIEVCTGPWLKDFTAVLVVCHALPVDYSHTLHMGITVTVYKCTVHHALCTCTYSSTCKTFLLFSKAVYFSTFQGCLWKWQLFLFVINLMFLLSVRVCAQERIDILFLFNG